VDALDVIIVVVVAGIGGIAVLSDPSRAAEIIRAVVDAILRRKHK
jgi:hypothetical protein